MTDAQGWRRKFGVLGPSTTIVQPDFDDMRPLGVTNHYSRIFTPNANAVSNEPSAPARKSSPAIRWMPCAAS
jgi:maleate isomerase